MKEIALIPKQVTVSSEAKFFGLDRGASDSSGLSVTYDIPEGLSKKELEQLIWSEKERLDLMVLVSERVKESITEAAFAGRVARMKVQYAKLRGLAPEVSEPPAPQPVPSRLLPAGDLNIGDEDVS